MVTYSAFSVWVNWWWQNYHSRRLREKRLDFTVSSDRHHLSPHFVQNDTRWHCWVQTVNTSSHRDVNSLGTPPRRSTQPACGLAQTFRLSTDHQHNVWTLGVVRPRIFNDRRCLIWARQAVSKEYVTSSWEKVLQLGPAEVENERNIKMTGTCIT